MASGQYPDSSDAYPNPPLYYPSSRGSMAPAYDSEYIASLQPSRMPPRGIADSNFSNDPDLAFFNRPVSVPQAYASSDPAVVRESFFVEPSSVSVQSTDFSAPSVPFAPSAPVTPVAPVAPVAVPKAVKPNQKNHPFAWVKSAKPVFWIVSGVLVTTVLFFSVFILNQLVQNENSGEAVNQMYEQSRLNAASSVWSTASLQNTAASASVDTDDTYSSTARTRNDSYPNNPFKQYSETVLTLQKANTDAIGQLTIPGLLQENVYRNIDDSFYYMNHDANRRSSSYGAVYLGSAVDFNTPPENITLFGNATAQGAVLGQIGQLSGNMPTLAATAAVVKLLTPYEDAYYKLFSAFIASSDVHSSRYFNQNTAVSFSSDAAMMRYVNTVKSLSEVPLDVDVQPGDRLLTITATSAHNGQPVILVYRLARADET